MATCKSCGAVIFWRKTTKGKSMPVDAKPTDEGTLMVNAQGLVYVAPPGERVKGKLWMAHWASCPQAKAHRARRDLPVRPLRLMKATVYTPHGEPMKIYAPDEAAMGRWRAQVEKGADDPIPCLDDYISVGSVRDQPVLIAGGDGYEHREEWVGFPYMLWWEEEP